MQRGYFQVQLIDDFTDFTPFQAIIIPDAISVNAEVGARLETYLKNGGRILLTGTSGYWQEKTERLSGVSIAGKQTGELEYGQYDESLAGDLYKLPIIMYDGGLECTAKEAEVLGRILKPIESRVGEKFSGHQHFAPGKMTDFPACVATEKTIWFAHPLFKLYNDTGHDSLRMLVDGAMRRLLLPVGPLITSDAPGHVRLFLRKSHEGHHVLHIVHAAYEMRGKVLGSPIQTVAGLPTLDKINITIRLSGLKKVRRLGQNSKLFCTQTNDSVSITLSSVTFHEVLLIESS
jgi:hypothetical protein